MKDSQCDECDVLGCQGCAPTCPTCGEDGVCFLCWGEDGYPGPLDPDDNPRALDRREYEPRGDWRDDQYNYSKKIGDE